MYLLGLSTEIVVLKFLAMLWYVVPFNFWKRGSHFNPTEGKLTRYTLKTKIRYDYRTCQTIDYLSVCTNLYKVWPPALRETKKIYTVEET